MKLFPIPQEEININPSIVQNLPVGHKLLIRKNGTSAQKPSPVAYELPITSTIETESIRK